VISNSVTKEAGVDTLATRFNKRYVEIKWGVSAMAMKAGLITDFNDCPIPTYWDL